MAISDGTFAQSYVLSLEARDMYDFKSLTLRCLEVTMQPQMVALMKRLLDEQENGAVPKIMQLYAHRLSLDVGWMLAQRELHSQLSKPGNYSTFFGIDKSPQGKLDYLMGQCMRLRHADVAEVCDLVCSLAGDTREPGLTNKQRMDQMMFCLKTLVQHVLTPVVVGSGNAGASASLRAWVWSSFLEGGKAGVAADISSMDALTSDFDEAALTMFGLVNGYMLFPWMQPDVEASVELDAAAVSESAVAHHAAAISVESAEGDDQEASGQEYDHDDFDFAAMPGLIHFNPDCDVDDSAVDQETPLAPLGIESEASSCFDWVADPTAAAPDACDETCEDGSEDSQFDMSGCSLVPDFFAVFNKSQNTHQHTCCVCGCCLRC